MFSAGIILLENIGFAQSFRCEMKIICKEKFLKEIDDFILKIKEGAVFVYPTDTIYGIGCDARNEKAVSRIREIKGRERKPFSVLAPDEKWILDNCVVDERMKKWLKKLPGAYTLILKLKSECVACSVNLGCGTLGVRIPKHWFSDAVSFMEFPIVTTSANKSGCRYMTSLEDADKSILEAVDFVIYEGEKKGKPSEIIGLNGGVLKR